MKLEITGRNLKITSSQKKFIKQKLRKFEKMLEKIINAEIIVLKEGYNYLAEVNLNSKIAQINVKGEGKIIDTALKDAFEHLHRQANKEKEKVKTQQKHKKKSVRKLEKEIQTNESEKQRTSLIRSDSYTLKPININEAIVMLKASKDPVFAFKNIDTGNFSVLFTEDNKNLKIIELS